MQATLPPTNNTADQPLPTTLPPSLPCRLMGRAASHVTLECALQTHPQLALICEEVAAHRWGLKDVVRQVRAAHRVGSTWCPGSVHALRSAVMGVDACSPTQSLSKSMSCRLPTMPCHHVPIVQVADMVAQRAELGKNFGVVLIPEGLVEFMHDVSELITGALCGSVAARATAIMGAWRRRSAHVCWHGSPWWLGWVLFAGCVLAARHSGKRHCVQCHAVIVSSTTAPAPCRAERADGAGRECA